MNGWTAALLLLGLSVEAAPPRTLGAKDVVLVACQYPVAKAAKDALAWSGARVVDADDRVALSVAVTMKPAVILLCDTSGVADDLVGLRKEERISKVPVVLISWGTERAGDLKIAAHATEVVKAPFSSEELSAAVSRALNSARLTKK